MCLQKESAQDLIPKEMGMYRLKKEKEKMEIPMTGFDESQLRDTRRKQKPEEK